MSKHVIAIDVKSHDLDDKEIKEFIELAFATENKLTEEEDDRLDIDVHVVLTGE